MNQHVQVNFVTRDARISVPSDPVTIPISSTVDDLQNIVDELLNDEKKIATFDFLVENEFIDSNLDEFLSKKNISAEIIEIEFTCRQCAPEISADINHDDFISCVRRNERYILSSSYDGTVQLQTVDSKVIIFTLTLHEKVKVVEWISLGQSDTDDSLFLTGGFAQVVRLWAWNPASQSVRCVAIGRGHQETILCISAITDHATSSKKPDLYATGSWDSTIKIWSANPNESDLFEETGGISHHRKSDDKVPVRIPRVTLAGHRNMVSSIQWFEEFGTSKLVSCSWDQTIRVWDVNTGSDTTGKCGECRCIVVSSPLLDISVARQGVLVGASDNKVRIFDLRAKDALAQIGFQGHSGWLTSVAWAPHRADQFVTGSVDRSVRLWDTRKPTTCLYNLMGHMDMVTCVDWAPPVATNSVIDTNSDVTPTASQHYILSASGNGSAKVYHYRA